MWLPLILWGGALLLAVSMVLRNLAGLWWLRRRSFPTNEGLRSLGDELADALRTRRPVQRIVPGLASPLLTGWFRPRLWLPEEVASMPETRIRAILHHELAHHRRRDLWWQSAASLACAIWWWNPLVWNLRKRLCHEAELAADEVVVSSSQPAADYAEILVHVAAGWTAGDGRRVGRAGVPMVGNSAIERRVRAILADNPFRNRMGWNAGFAAMFLAFIGTVIASLTAIARQPGETDTFSKTGQAELVERLIRTLEKRQERLKFVHFETTSTWTMKLDDGSTVSNESVPSKAEAWMELAENRYRIDHKPQVSPWIDGVAPFFVGNSSEISDGKRAYMIDRGREDEAREAGVTAPYLVLSLYRERQSLDLLRRLARSRPLDGMRLSLEEKTVDGRRIIELTEEFFQRSGEPFSQRQTYQLDAEDPAILVLHRMESAWQEPQTIHEWQLLESARNEAGDVYPRRFRQTVFGPRGQDTHFTVTRFDVLDRLPAGITERPAPEVDKYVSASGAVIRRDKVMFRFRDAANDSALPGVKFQYRLNEGPETDAVADPEGSFSVPMPAGEVTALNVEVKQTGYARHMVRFKKQGDPLQLPESHAVKLQPSSSISGVVMAEDGTPISGAKVVAWLSDGPRVWTTFRDGVTTGDVTVMTDEKGGWRLDGFPPDLTNLTMRVSHPDYIPSTDVDGSSYWMISRQTNGTLRDGTSKITLKSGARLEGRVVDWKGDPVAKARITAGEDNFNNKKPLARTDETGAFLMKALKQGTTLITVEAPGCRPYQATFDVPPAAPLLIRLEEPAVLRGRVVREDGSPCADLDVSVSEWKKTRTLKFRTRTDADGHFVWNGAPLEEVTLTFGWGQDRKGEFLSGYALTATAEERTIVMKPGMRVRSTVVDDVTGAPLPRFTFTYGHPTGADSYWWSKDSRKTISTGEVEWSTNYFRECCFLIEAEGYETLQTKVYQAEQQTIGEVWRLKKK
jgi:beta-lactamase regulating signal transducer with metallopeptidase domain